MPKLNPITGSLPLPDGRDAGATVRKAPSSTTGRQECPNSGWVDMQFALGIEELPYNDPHIEVMKRLVEEDGKSEEDVLIWGVYALRSPRPATNRADLALSDSSSRISNTWSAARTS
jgi:hypothetical protein